MKEWNHRTRGPSEDYYPDATRDEIYAAAVTPLIALERKLIGNPGPYQGSGYFTWVDKRLFKVAEISPTPVMREIVELVRERTLVNEGDARSALINLSNLLHDRAFTDWGNMHEYEEGKILGYSDLELMRKKKRPASFGMMNINFTMHYDLLRDTLKEAIVSHTAHINHLERCFTRFRNRHHLINSVVAEANSVPEFVGMSLKDIGEEFDVMNLF